MGRKRSSFKETEAARAIRAAIRAGIEHPVVEIDTHTGKITIRSGTGEAPAMSEREKHRQEWKEALGGTDKA